MIPYFITTGLILIRTTIQVKISIIAPVVSARRIAKDILHVKERLGHRNINSTLIYTHLVNFESDEYHTATSKSLEEDEELLKAGFEYVTEREDVKIFRKRK